MSHTVSVRLIADQVISIKGTAINVHDIGSIIVDGEGGIKDVYLIFPNHSGWLSDLPVKEYYEVYLKEGQ